MTLTLKDGNYIPHYIGTNLTGNLHDKFKFKTDYEIISEKICKQTKTRKSTQNFKNKNLSKSL